MFWLCLSQSTDTRVRKLRQMNIRKAKTNYKLHNTQLVQYDYEKIEFQKGSMKTEMNSLLGFFGVRIYEVVESRKFQ